MDSVVLISPVLGPIMSFAVTEDRDVVLHEQTAGLPEVRPATEPDPAASYPRPIFTVRRVDGQLLERIPALPAAPELWGSQWFVSPSPAGVWTGPADRFELVLWSLDGQRLRTLTWNVDWFPPGVQPDPGFPLTAPPPPMLLHASQDDEHRLWVYVAIPDPNFEPLSDPRAAYELNAETISRYFDTYVEVVDLDRTQVIARTTYETMLRPVCGDQAVYAAFHSADGDTRVRVLLPELKE
jgi:hypothetical protein